MMGWRVKGVCSVAATFVAAIGAFAHPVAAQSAATPATSGSARREVPAKAVYTVNGQKVESNVVVRLQHATDSVVRNPRADSLYRAAREAMVNNDPNTSIRLFSQLARRYPRSQHATAALYFSGFLLYRQYQPGGEPSILRRALTPLRQLEQNYPHAPQASDGRALQNRICGELGQLGDSVCRTQVVVSARPSRITALSMTVDSSGEKRATGKYTATAPGSISIQISPGVSVQRDTSCHNEKELDSYVAALNSLWKVDSTRAMTAAGEVLNKRDRCLTRLREQTLLMVMQRPAPVLGMAPVIFEVARNDPDSNVKKLATMWLLSQEWEPPTAQFLHSIFGQTFRVKTTAKARESADGKTDSKKE